MPKKEQFAIRLAPAALEMIDELVGSIYGTNPSEVARALILAQLKTLAAEGLVTWRVARSDVTTAFSGEHQSAAANTRKSRRSSSEQEEDP